METTTLIYILLTLFGLLIGAVLFIGIAVGAFFLIRHFMKKDAAQPPKA